MENNKNTNLDEDRIIEVVLENGEKAEGIILFTFEANGDNFVLYEIQEQLFAAKVDEQGGLKSVEEDEWSLIEKVYEEYQETYVEEGEDE
ncbi:DUF1292 domain-containing protein [Mycoplasma marinum]|uniref:DUF1292 domain-containing protein n=1 Tax=Mycoplasma marinum TaxID=1937190 RepID=A0A4R0XVE6_9MOLU|nr:DUF1292 domain-containing protein [Mycoplasma marinum]TCG11712.1 hypothetical protein C4B24_00990 [Mycoplasma marinum]